MVDPEEQLAKFGVDAVRYFLLKEGSLSRDGGMLAYCDPPPPTPIVVCNSTAVNEGEYSLFFFQGN